MGSSEWEIFAGKGQKYLMNVLKLYHRYSIRYR
ncbi:hypothetical protein BC781_11030 [Sediminitomix flava]|uniref:Uncharacterized protein n=1 Tax=Sediminitomix flava TaxID=379075 RepID=A0A315YYM2_SEDFL|nr:hypothetical protein BC781_11030 [Sediminitomix flava]